MADAPVGIDLRAVLEIVKLRRVLVAAVVAAVMILVCGFTFTQPRVYRANAVVELVLDQGAEVGTTRLSAQDRQRALQTEVEFARSTTVWLAVADQLGDRPDIEIRPSGSADVIEVIGSAGSADRAAEVANTYAETYLQLRAQQTRQAAEEEAAALDELIDTVDDDIVALSPRIDGAAANEGLEPGTGTAEVILRDELDDLNAQRDEYTTALRESERAIATPTVAVGQVISSATAPISAAEPQIMRNLLVGLVLALVLGAGAAVARDLLSGTVRDSRHLAGLDIDVPVLAVVPDRPVWARQLADVTTDKVPGGVLEAVRRLRSVVCALNSDYGVDSVTVTSVDPGAGKSTTAVLLAAQTAAVGRQVVMVDADCRRSRVHRLLNVDPAPGLTDLIAGQGHEVADVLQSPKGAARLNVLAAGRPVSDPGGFVAAAHLSTVLESLESRCDLVLVDTPPISVAGDALEACRCTDTTILVVRQGRSKADHVVSAVNEIRRWGGRVGGIVMIGRTGPEDYGIDRAVPADGDGRRGAAAGTGERRPQTTSRRVA